MNQKRLAGGAVLLVCLLLFFFLSLGGTLENERAPISDMIRRMFCSPSQNLKTVFNYIQAHFFAPNLDFRSEEKVMERGGAEDRLKEAIAESVGKTKATVEDSAKSAAKLATETIQQTKDKVKRSFSPQRDEQPEEEEL